MPMTALLEVMEGSAAVHAGCGPLRANFAALTVLDGGERALRARVAVLGDWAFSRVETHGHVMLGWAGVGAADARYAWLVLSSSGRSMAETPVRLAVPREGALYAGSMLPPLLRLSGDARHLIALIPASILPEGAAAGRPFAIDYGAGAVLAATLRTVEAQASVAATAGLARLLPALAALISTVIDEQEIAVPPGRSGAGDRSRIADHIELHLDDPALAARTTARDCGMSLRRLHRIFEGSGESYAATVRRLRMERAVALLVNEEHAIGEVAVRAGFADPAYFATAFKRLHGCSPRQWRRRRSF